MAAVTQNQAPYRHVIGDLVTRFFKITGSTGDTLASNMQNIQQVITSPGSLITAVSFTNLGVITFTSSGAITAEIVQVIARVG